MTDGLLRVTKYSLKTLWWKSLILAGVLVLPSLGMRFLALLHQMRSDSQFIFPPLLLFWELYFPLLIMMGAGLLGFCLWEVGSKWRLMPRMPVSPVELVSGVNLSLLLILFMVSLVANGAYRLLLFDADGFHAYWPVTGPLLFLATLIVVFHCLIWNLRAIGFARLLFWISFVWGMCYWFRSRYYPNGFNEFVVPWAEITWPEFFTMLTVFVAAWIETIRSCARVRCGTAVPSRTWERVWQGVGRLGHLTWGVGPAKTDSVASAFARLYWRDSCSAVLLLYVLMGTGVFTFSLVMDESPGEMGALAIACLCYLSCFISLSLAGAHTKVYLAAAPLADRDMAVILIRALLKLVVLFVSTVLLLGLAGGSLVSLLVQGAEATRTLWPWSILSAGNISWYHAYALLLLVAWIMLSNTISLLWSPYQKLRHFCLIVFILFPIPAYLVYELFNRLSSSIIGDVIFILISALIWSVTIIAYIRACGSGLISARAVWLTALFCLVVPACYWNFWQTNGLSLRVFLSSLLILAVTPFATIPVGLSRSRHC
ncbi:hypothetical protein [Gimesia panareensis]|uniref:hypothetical protein n=1 Tax=Gimesia panareensis TaxID=2527978 RepID=UPI0011890545|nr:hypothetical protein [Gimesia panareensis]QDU53414.1 hypothetical protein Pan110_58050 [Gimesia panareensis]